VSGGPYLQTFTNMTS